MPRLSRRVVALEQAMPSKVVSVICIRFLRPGDEKPQLAAANFNGQRYDRLPGESESDFTQRVIGRAIGIQMLFEAPTQDLARKIDSRVI